ncbi:MAG TPA: hypothetical protein PLA50_11015 [Bacteroidia bacterium]|nr:hypothetical protein [Bacteroidia bacterium]
MHHCPECEKLRKRIEKLEQRLQFIESKPALKAGFNGERLISRLVDGIPTAFSTPHDVTTIRGGKLIEVKLSNLNLAYKGGKTKRWTWHDPLGRKGRKKYHRLILVGKADPNVDYEEQFTDPYIYFDVPFENAADLTRKGGAIQISTNPRTARTPEAKLLFTKYILSPSELNARYGILDEIATQPETDN